MVCQDFDPALPLDISTPHGRGLALQDPPNVNQNVPGAIHNQDKERYCDDIP